MVIVKTAHLLLELKMKERFVVRINAEINSNSKITVNANNVIHTRGPPLIRWFVSLTGAMLVKCSLKKVNAKIVKHIKGSKEMD